MYTLLSSLLLAGLALANSCPSNQVVNGRQCQVTCGQDRPGGDYATIQLDSFEACITACGQDNRCLTAQFHKSSGECYLKSTVNAPVADDCVDSVVCGAGSTLTTSTCPAKTVTVSSTCAAATKTVTKVSTVTKAGTTGVSTKTATQSFTSTVTAMPVTITSISTLTSIITSIVPTTLTSSVTLPPIVTTVTLPVTIPGVASTVTISQTITTTTTNPSPTISGCNVPDYAGCQEGREITSGTSIYVEACNVSYDGNDIGVGAAGDQVHNLQDCANLCEQTTGCVAALFAKTEFGVAGVACFLKSAVVQTHDATGTDALFKLIAKTA